VASRVDGKLPLELDGVSVTIGGKAAPVFYISPDQINVQAPSDLPSGPAPVVVQNAGGVSDPVSATVQSLLPGFFLLGRNYIAAARPDGSLVGPAGMLDGVRRRRHELVKASRCMAPASDLHLLS
jgi:uncharacterized protein (TIGR03437 family)